MIDKNTAIHYLDLLVEAKKENNKLGKLFYEFGGDLYDSHFAEIYNVTEEVVWDVINPQEIDDNILFEYFQDSIDYLANNCQWSDINFKDTQEFYDFLNSDKFLELIIPSEKEIFEK